MDKILAKTLITMVCIAVVAALVFGAYNKYFVEKISWSNWEEVEVK